MSAMLKQKLIDIANGFTKYGLWKGGSSSLSEMNDVTFNNLQANDVLTYNGSEWINDDNLQTQIDTLNRNFTVEYLNCEYVSNKTVTATKTGFYLICCNAFSQNSSSAYLNIKVDGGQYMSAYNSNQFATLSLSTVLFLREGQTVTKEVINCEDRIDAYNLFQVTYIGKN